MANEFIARKGLLVPTGSIYVISGAVTASNFIGTASAAVSSSYAITSSYALNANLPTGIVSSSVQFNNLTDPFTGSFTGSFSGDGSQLTNINVGTSITTETYKFVGDGATQLYILSQSYLKNSLTVSVDGLTFTPDIDFTYVTGSIEFVEVPPSSSNILITALLNIQDNLTGSYTGSFIGDGHGLTNLPSAVTVDTYEFIGNGSTTNYILSKSYAGNSIFISVDGLTYNPSSDYTILGQTASFTNAPPSESVVFIKALINSGTSVTGSFTGSLTGIATFTQLPNINIVADNHLFVGDGSTLIYTLSQSYSPSILTVSVDGMVNALTDDYTVATNQLTFITAPPTSSNILIKGIRLTLG